MDVVTDKTEAARARKRVQNRHFYEEHKEQNHRASLLCAIEHKGRVPKLVSVEKYNILIEELVPKWRAYCASKPREEIRPIKIMKMQTLLLNMV